MILVRIGDLMTVEKIRREVSTGHACDIGATYNALRTDSPKLVRSILSPLINVAFARPISASRF